MSIIITKHPQQLKYRVHFDNVPMDELMRTEGIDVDTVRFKLEIEEAYTRRTLAGWLERMRKLSHDFPYGADGWMTIDILTIVRAVSNVFTPSQEYSPLQSHPTLDGPVVMLTEKLSPPIHPSRLARAGKSDDSMKH